MPADNRESTRGGLLSRLRFRTRIASLVVTSFLALAAVTAVAVVLGKRTEQQIAGIETRYVPLLELDRDLKAMFASITSSLEAAASAAEESELEKADAHRDAFVRRLAEGREAIAENGSDADELLREFRRYYELGRDLSLELMAEEPADDLIARAEAMRSAQNTFAQHLDTATTPDRTRLARAFASARAAQRVGIIVDLAVAGLVLIGMIGLSWWIVRGTHGALGAVSSGIERLARGDFSEEIPVTSEDEFGELAREANRTAMQLRNFRDRLEEKAQEVQRASEYKSQFLANMSHELRTPLNSVMILSRILAENGEGNLSGKQIEFAQVIHRAGEELLFLINDVLDLSKVEAGKLEVAREEVPLDEVASYLTRMFQPIAEQKGLALEVALASGLPTTMSTDRSRLHQILKNLVSNAIKFTERGTVSVAIYPAAAPPAGVRPGLAPPGSIGFAVSDTGIGIARDQHERIFEAFIQADGGASRSRGGTGLGLTIARQLSRLLGGDLAIDSERESGTSFVLYLPAGSGAIGEQAVRAVTTRLEPVAPQPGPPPALVGGPVAAPRLTGRKVLVADDDMRNVYSLSSALRRLDIEVVVACDGQEALETAESSPGLDAVLIDVMMPRMDGLEAIRRIRALPGRERLPIVALTARTQPGDRESCLAAGATDYLPKPIDLDQLVALLSERLATSSVS